MVFTTLVIIAILSFFICWCNLFGIASFVANSSVCVCLDNTFTNLSTEAIENLSSIMIPQLAALLAICITVFVFLFTELNTRAQDHPGERLICNDLQKDFALRVERLSVESILLITLNYCSEHIYGICVNGICLGHFLYALLTVESFWGSICMIWYCVDVAQYQRHLKWRAWDLTKRRYEALRDNYGAHFPNCPERSAVSHFWSEYNMTSQLVCTIAGEQSESTEMNEKVIGRFEELVLIGNRSTKGSLCQALINLYNYQLALSVYEGYVFSDNYADNKKARRYSLKVVSYLLRLLNKVLDFWNRKFRNRPTVQDDRIPGKVAGENEPSAAQIAQGLWRQIVQGNETFQPMRSQRLYNMAFTGLNFNDAQLQNVRMESCRIVGATFDNANLQNALFCDCDLRSASFKNVDCTNITLESSNLSDIVIADAVPDTDADADTPIQGSAILTPLENTMLTNMSFDGCTMERASFEPANHNDSNHNDSIDLSDSNFSNVDLQDARIKKAKIDRCIFKSAWLSGTKLKSCAGESVDFTGALFIGSSKDSRLFSCTFNRSNMSGCTFSNAQIDKCKFPFLNAVNAVFENVRLQHTDFMNAAFTNASFLYSKMKDISMENTDLTHMHIIDSEINDCKFEGSAGHTFQILNGLMDDATFLSAHLTSPEFSRTIFMNCNFDESSLSGALFHRVGLYDTRFVQTLLLNADFADATLEEVKATDAFFSHSVFDRAKLTNVTMTGTSLSDAMFRHAHLCNCTFDNCIWDDASFNNAELENCCFTTSLGPAHEAVCKALLEARSLKNVTVNGEIIER